MKRIYLKPYRLAFSLALGQLLIINALELLKPWPLKLIIDHVLSGKPPQWEFAQSTTARRTTLIIAHRLSTVRQADLIVVLQQGRIVEQGNFNDPLRTQGPFASLYKTQFGTHGEERKFRLVK
jgi:hypothetical protein